MKTMTLTDIQQTLAADTNIAEIELYTLPKGVDNFKIGDRAFDDIDCDFYNIRTNNAEALNKHLAHGIDVVDDLILDAEGYAEVFPDQVAYLPTFAEEYGNADAKVWVIVIRNDHHV